MNQNQKDVISERGMLAVCIVVGLILFLHQSVHRGSSLAYMVAYHKHNRLTSQNQGIWTHCFRCPDSFLC